MTLPLAREITPTIFSFSSSRGARTYLKTSKTLQALRFPHLSSCFFRKGSDYVFVSHCSHYLRNPKFGQGCWAACCGGKCGPVYVGLTPISIRFLSGTGLEAHGTHPTTRLMPLDSTKGRIFFIFLLLFVFLPSNWE